MKSQSCRQFSAVKIIFVLCVIFAVVGCVSKVMDSWMGAHQSELIAKWGIPDRESSDGNGGKVLVYSKYVSLGQTPGKATRDYWGTVTYTAPKDNGYQRTRMFYVNAQGYIYNWKSQGL